MVLSADPKGKNFLYPHGNSIIIRDFEHPYELCDIYTEHSTTTTVAKYSPSGFYVASADQTGKIRIWDTTQKEHILKNEFQPFAGVVKDLAWSPDSQRIVAVGEGREKFGHVFSMDTGTSIGEISGHSKVINSCDFKPSRPFKIVTGSEDLSVVLYEGPPFKFKSQIQDHKGYVQAIRFSPNGEHFASAGFDGKLLLYNSSDYTKVLEFGSPAHKGGVYAIAWSPDGSQLLSASGDKTCKLWDVSSGSIVTEFCMGSDILDQQVSCLWQGSYMISVSLSGFINYLDKDNPEKPKKIIKGHNKSITALASRTERGSDQILTGSHDGYLCRWSILSECHDRIKGSHSNQVQDMAIGEDCIFSCGLDDTINAIELDGYNFVANFEPIKLLNQPKGLANVQGTKILVVACVNEIQVFDDHDLRVQLKIDYEPSSVDVGPDSLVVVGGFSDHKVHIYELQHETSETGEKEIKGLKSVKNLEHTGGVTDVKMCSKYLAACDANRKVVIYHLSDFTQVHQVEWGFHTAKVTCLSWLGSDLLVSGGLDSNLIVWFPSEPTKHLIIRNAHPQSQITRVAFASEGRIVSTGQDASVRIWKSSSMNKI